MSTIYSNNIRPVSGTTDAISIDSSTNKVGINSSSPTSNLQIHEDSTAHCTIDITNTTTTNAALKGLKIGRGSDGAGGHGILLNYEDNKDWIFSTSTGSNNATEKMRLTANGRLGVGTASLSNKFQVEEDSSSNWVASYHDSRTDQHTSAGMIVFSRTSSYTGVGSITTSESSTAFNTSSDYRLKENLVGLDGALDRLAQLKTYRFNFKADPNTTVDGFVAHEVADVVPEAVTGEKDEMETVQLPVEGGEPDETVEVERIKPQGIDQSKLVPLLVAAVQELSAKVAALEGQA